jgi:Lipocalin-like domain
MKTMRPLATTLVVALCIALGASVAAAQSAKTSAKTLRDGLVGTWSFVIAEITAADGKKTLPFGDRPTGMLIFTADGHFSQVHVAGDLPKIASNNRLAGTAEDNKAIVHGSLALFGAYTVDEDKKTLTFKIEGSTYPNLAGVAQTRTIDLLSDDEFRNTNPAASRDGPAIAANIYKRKPRHD